MVKSLLGPSRILLVDERADVDIVDPAEIGGKAERGNGRRTDEPFGAKDDRRSLRPADVGRDFTTEPMQGR